jgi:tRNA A37 threonylcarbamoyladenosine biosynthesis protein TsaE
MEAKEYIEKALAGLKDFQLETVNYTIKQFFENNKTKMLIADEVGLGKTIVSRGIVAKMYEKHLLSKSKSKTFNMVMMQNK